jgi:CDGSH-type Zn-finger protein/uncharacterized Fe-S cluster protein YjdI
MADDRDPGGAPASSGSPTEPGATPGIARGDRVHAFHAPGITVTWSRARCIHVAQCVMSLPEVFQPGRRPWVDATRDTPDEVAHAVLRCPTGALHFERSDGGAAEPEPATNEVRFARNGPVYLHGRIEVQDEAGGILLRDTRVALCRCGRSAMKPLCDNRHQAIGFREGGELPAKPPVSEHGVADPTLRVLPRPNASVELSGPFVLKGTGGAVVRGTSTKLCRCGQSGNKPFCDGSHERVGFRSD